MLLACLLLGAARLSRAAEPVPGECAPPHSLVALLPLADLTDRTWELWSGESPAVLVARLLADSLEHGRGRHVLRVPLVADADPALPLSRAADDDPALRAARRAEAEFAISGSVSVLTHEDTREGGRFARWGMGAPDARTHVRVSVTLRVLDTRDGSVIIESNASRDRAGRGTASVGRPEPAGRNPNPTDDPLVDEVLGEVLSDLTSTVDQRLDASWRARVILEGRGIYVLDAGASRGLFPGERLDVWRPGIQLFDEDMLHIGDDTRIGSVVVEALDGRGRARARLVEGDARMGDLVRPCSGASGPAVSLRR